jgi:hypothetical protein
LPGSAVRKRAGRVQREIDDIVKGSRRKRQRLSADEAETQLALKDEESAAVEALLSMQVDPALPLPSAPRTVLCTKQRRAVTSDIELLIEHHRADAKLQKKREARAMQKAEDAQAAADAVVIPEEPDRTAFDDAKAAVAKLRGKLRKTGSRAMQDAEARMQAEQTKLGAAEERWQDELQEALAAQH